MAYRRIYTRIHKFPATDYPAGIRAESDRLQAAGTLTRTVEPLTSPAELAAQNVGADQIKFTVTEVWTSQAARTSYVNWQNTNYPGAHDAWMSTNNCTQTEISAGEV